MRKVIDDCITLNSNLLMREHWEDGLIRLECSIKWRRGDNLKLILQECMARLLYSIRDKEVEQAINMVKTPCHFGGHRHYFLCPGCSTRRYKLIQGGHGFFCRQCYRLPYYSQQCGEADGLVVKQHKIESRLTDHKGPKRRTHTIMKLIDQLTKVEDKLNQISMRRFGAMLF